MGGFYSNSERATIFAFSNSCREMQVLQEEASQQVVKVQLRGINLKIIQVTANDKVSPSAIFKSANEKITSIYIILKIYVKN